MSGASTSKEKGEGFDVQKHGDARIALIGYPSVGKSTLQHCLTGVRTAIASYEFTTLTCVPGIIKYRDTTLQLLDLPGIVEGAANGRGRGRQVIAVARSADIILMVLDATKDAEQRQRLEYELETVGIRLNKSMPNITITRKAHGGILFNSTVPLTRMNQKLCQTILNTYKIFNADVIFREDCGPESLIDVIEGNRKYIKCLYVYNKIDMLSIDQIDALARSPDSVCISSERKWNLDQLLHVLWGYLNIVRVYTKRALSEPNFEEPIILTFQRGGASIKNLLPYIHKDLLKSAKSAMVWGTSVKFYPQQVTLDHVLEDEDVVQIIKKKTE